MANFTLNFILKGWIIPLSILLLSCNQSSLNSQTMQKKPQFTNALINETSPYLLQHAHNPVNWVAWGPEAFEKARNENKLVLISVGYAACHWCHVMEHESFEDTTVAQIMNANYVCIKVDREERPDVDNIYMNAVQLITGRGGWPLNCFALPDGRPFYGGTYFPKQQWIQVLNGLHETYQTKPEEIEKYATQLKEGIVKMNLIEPVDGQPEFSVQTLTEMVLNWSRGFDSKYGGNNYAPKFPMPNNYQFLLRYGALTHDVKAIKHVKHTLKQMAYGGIYDQIGGGFARYSTDAQWKAPHFEKMLYDNAQLVSLYAEAFQATKDSLYKQVVYETLEFIERELTDVEGGFYSSLDADSEGEEGKFYVWKIEELKALLSEDEFSVCEKYYNLNAKGKWEHENYILLRHHDDDQVAKELNLSLSQLNEKVAQIKSTLMKARDQRIRPGLDDKILTSWNALMISGFCDAARVFNDENLKTMAEQQMAFLLENQWRDDGGLNHNYKKGVSTINGYLEDYSLVIEALIKCYENTFNEDYLKKASDLTDYAFLHFFNQESGMFYFTSNQDDPLVARSYETTDNVIPASNSVMARNLFYLGQLYDRNEWIEISNRMLHTVQGDFNKNATSYSNWGMLLLHHTHPYFEVAFTGDNYLSFNQQFHVYYLPNKLVMGADSSSKLPLFEGKFTDESMVYVCVNKACQRPVTAIEEAVKQMR